MKSKFYLFVCVFSVICFSFNATANAQPGSLDNTFDTDGLVITDLGGSDEKGASVAVQADGKIVIMGETHSGSNTSLFVARYNTDGSLDNSFSADGYTIVDFGGGDEWYALAIQTDGKIVVGGTAIDSVYSFALARFNTDGSLDNSFNSDGKITTRVGGFCYSLTLQPDGKILAFGSAYNGLNYDLTLIRYNTDGSLDNTFNSDGIVTTDFTGSHDYGRSVTLQPDGKIVVAGTSLDGGTYTDFVLARYNTNGSIDSSFSNDGKTTTDFFSANDEAWSVLVRYDGKIIASGTADNPGHSYDFAMAYYNSDGTVDESIGEFGKVVTDFGNSEGQSIYASAFMGNEKLIVVGSAYNPVLGNTDMAVASYVNEGYIDYSFAGDGKVSISLNANYYGAMGLAIQSDHKILALAHTVNTDMDIALVRYNGFPDLGLENNHQIEMNNYPNPFTTQTILETEIVLNDATLLVQNCFGQTVKQINHLNGQTIVLHRDQLPAGMYLVQMVENNQVMASKKLIVVD